ncbi:LSU ribosomal protein L4P [Candidatus Kryptonium thompsonii]|jgi:large subunit ribosomal protein L4|uniref:Large ribosomal subunit protein uL4 n=1 Tax=Candidatus Kryptonium thompsonii TaxID=1633631 RepID=A0A0P1L727_9BACT|nr:50S ribosomal protein L4 [Candidatus Kryptonium thompsoni]CUS76813.1 LSU ribosomal protein L4P [Candidatus Kryptonium thompsoni]CUS77704.1 LSU ribosomal protein L4P [Candidatus Kryptonium thompsoni]CUS81409.1 LSU ribosomal protein L4P [Candidatus Kryptonium thompsoni]CUS88783.1 LSU ribosomal protein L4P [Candidatus Kryptonium thompsoni]CUT01328.1 LSU ribosomal protein L4P [Candidatus Kryptonium thompsoni]
MRLEVYKIDGTKSGEYVELRPDIFEIKPNDHAIYLAVKAYLANQRQGTHKTKTRGEVRGGGRKPWPQKHTGRARAGSIRSPLWVGGGTVFGPVPRDYSLDLPKKVKQLARKSALSYKAKDEQIIVVEDFTFEEPKTKKMVEILKAFNLLNKKVLLLTASTDLNVYKSGRNIPGLNILEAYKASTYDILNNQMILIQKSAVEVLQNTFTE